MPRRAESAPGHSEQLLRLRKSQFECEGMDVRVASERSIAEILRVGKYSRDDTKNYLVPMRKATIIPSIKQRPDVKFDSVTEGTECESHLSPMTDRDAPRPCIPASATRRRASSCRSLAASLDRRCSRACSYFARLKCGCNITTRLA